MRSDDLTPQLLPPRSSDPANQTFRQGTILTFDQTTGANTVSLAGAVLINLPLLNIGDTVNLKPGDAVLLGKMNNAMFIMGRVIPAGNANLTGNIVQTAVGEGITAGAFGTTTGFLAYAVTLPIFTIPVWCNKVDVLCIATATLNNSTAGKTQMLVQAQAGADLGPIHSTNVPAGDFGTVTSAHSATATGAIGGSTFNCAILVRTTVAYASSVNNLAQVSAFVTYTRV